MNSRLSSCIYRSKVMHNRLAPKRHVFWYNIYLFYINLDELPQLERSLKWFSRNSFNLFSFRDKEHLQLPKENPDQSKQVRAHVEAYLKDNGVDGEALTIMLLTNLNVLGYNFNPVSFYFCFDTDGQPVCAVAEISNTYREMKLFFFGKDELNDDIFKKITQKYFYVSPFIDHDLSFDFKLGVPGERLNIKIDDLDKEGNRFFLSTLTGERKPLTNGSMLRYFFAMPFIPLQIMGLIHWHALKLWLKKLPYHPKKKNPELQQDVYKPYKQ